MEENKEKIKKVKEKKIEKKEILESKPEAENKNNSYEVSQEGTKEIKTENKENKVVKKIKKTEAFVRGLNMPLSTKTSYAICKFIKNKDIETAIKGLNEIIDHKRALPMKGEIPHRRGKIMSGRYPEKAIGQFIKLLQTLNANAIVNEIENPVIIEAISGFGSRPFGRFGRTRKKRSNIKITVKPKIKEKKK